MLLATLLLGCAPEEGASSTPDDSGTPSVGLCDDAPVTTWENFGNGFVLQHCQSCHASTAPERQGAPEQVVFDTEEDAWAWADRILERAAGDEATMPPQGGVEADDRYLLEVWLSCGG